MFDRIKLKGLTKKYCSKIDKDVRWRQLFFKLEFVVADEKTKKEKQEE